MFPMLSVQNYGSLKPWMRGPFELIRHAEGHLRAKGDTDRRIALIGFDNAIEVSIDVFVRLHPTARAGMEFSREVVDQALRSYHSKIRFLDNHVQTLQIPLSIPVDEIVWYHQLRNELYHAGNGMVPEEHVIEGARVAALAVFEALFGLDVADLLGVERAELEHVARRPAIQTQNPEMEFLGLYIELEQALRSAIPPAEGRPMTIRHMWQVLLESRPDIHDLTSDFDSLLQIRNMIVHGRSTTKFQDLELEPRKEAILRILDRLQS